MLIPEDSPGDLAKNLVGFSCSPRTLQRWLQVIIDNDTNIFLSLTDLKVPSPKLELKLPVVLSYM